MNGAHLHLVLNHFPILGSLFGLVILAYGLWSKNKAFMNAGLIALIAIALITIPTFMSGEAAEEVIEHNSGVSEQLIEDHEERGKIGFLLMELLGITAVVALFLSAVLIFVNIPWIDLIRNQPFLNFSRAGNIQANDFVRCHLSFKRPKLL